MAFPDKNNRRELEINLFYALLMALLFTAIVYIAVFPFPDSYINNLLFERGYIQYFTIFTACLVASITLVKYLKIQQEGKIFKKLGGAENFDFSNHKSIQLINLQQEFTQESKMVTNRLARLVLAYIESGSRKTVAEFALDDSSFYLNSSESSYALPRILVWAIPLLGFIGTVIGISQAVSGFTGFLANTAEIDQIREGIGSVTSGLALAFDTTLLALLLSVVVMIPLVLVEKKESQLLLATDIYINDKFLPRLHEKSSAVEALNSQKIVKTITNTIQETLPKKEEFIQPIKEVLPSAQELIAPAEMYAKEAAQNLVREFVNEFQAIHQQEEKLISTMKEINQVILQDRQSFLATFGQQNNLNQSIITNVKELIELVQQHEQENQDNLQQASLNISNQLNKAANSLEEKVIALEKSSSQIAQLNQLQPHLEKIVQVLNSVEQMQDNLSGIKERMSNLEPTLRDLSKPRIMKIVEQIDP